MGGCGSLGTGADTDPEKGLEALRAYKLGCCPRQYAVSALSQKSRTGTFPSTGAQLPRMNSALHCWTVLLGTEPKGDAFVMFKGKDLGEQKPGNNLFSASQRLGPKAVPVTTNSLWGTWKQSWGWSPQVAVSIGYSECLWGPFRVLVAGCGVLDLQPESM